MQPKSNTGGQKMYHDDVNELFEGFLLSVPVQTITPRNMSDEQRKEWNAVLFDIFINRIGIDEDSPLLEDLSCLRALYSGRDIPPFNLKLLIRNLNNTEYRVFETNEGNGSPADQIIANSKYAQRSLSEERVLEKEKKRREKVKAERIEREEPQKTYEQRRVMETDRSKEPNRIQRKSKKLTEAEKRKKERERRKKEDQQKVALRNQRREERQTEREKQKETEREQRRKKAEEEKAARRIQRETERLIKAEEKRKEREQEKKAEEQQKEALRIQREEERQRKREQRRKEVEAEKEARRIQREAERERRKEEEEAEKQRKKIEEEVRNGERALKRLSVRDKHRSALFERGETDNRRTHERTSDKELWSNIVASMTSSLLRDKENKYFSLSDWETISQQVTKLAPSLSDYICEIERISPLKYGELSLLFYIAQHSEVTARNRIIEAHLPVVIRVALSCSLKYGLEIEECISSGNHGLIKALDTYISMDYWYKEDVSFTGYCISWIYGSIIQEILPLHGSVDYPKHLVEKAYEIYCELKRTDLLYCPQNIQYDFIKEIATEKYGSSKSESNMISNIISGELPLNIGEWNDETDLGYIQHLDSPERSVYDSTLKKELNNVLKTLTPREEKVLKLRFGIEDGRPRTLEEVGKKFNVPRERIRQIEAKALRKLRHPSRSKKLKDWLD